MSPLLDLWILKPCISGDDDDDDDDGDDHDHEVAVEMKELPPTLHPGFNPGYTRAVDSYSAILAAKDGLRMTVFQELNAVKIVEVASRPSLMFVDREILVAAAKTVTVLRHAGLHKFAHRHTLSSVRDERWCRR
ncbi:hypothetical protein RRG08_011893 [Elysia crispata]|uniref:Uncharacterized protein n=1 Tax=Elysia crispata TaxID=231223 RepID=A0AAE0ZME1_9GAST|nr:hypothetical protein RRG08_011893 [Elysia crispata]